jgi:hypothetical protein
MTMIADSRVRLDESGIATGVEVLRLVDAKRYELEKCGYRLGFTVISHHEGSGYSVRAEFLKQEEVSC